MKKLFKIITVLLLVLAPLSAGKVLLAQTTPAVDMEYEYDWDFDDWGIDIDTTDVDSDLTDDEAADIVAGIFATIFGGTILVFTVIAGVITYVYTAFTLQKVAKKLGDKDAWYAWIPVLNTILFFRLGDQNPWLLLLAFVPVVGAFALSIISVIAMMKVCEKMGYDKLLGLLMLIPLAGLILWGVLAWGKSPKKTEEKTKQLEILQLEI